MKKILLLAMPGWTVDFPPLSLTYVAGLIEKAGWGCRYYDLNLLIYRMVQQRWRKCWLPQHAIFWYDYEATNELFRQHQSEIESLLEKLILQGDYDLVAFSVNKCTRFFSLKAVSFIKSLKPDLPILFGGVDCFPGEQGLKLLQLDGGPNVICQGEAELTLPVFLKKFEQTGDYRVNVPGFAFRVDGQVVDHGPASLPTGDDLNCWPDWSQIDFTGYAHPGGFSMFTSRGCLNRCAFCSESANYRKFRSRQAEDVLAEMIAANSLFLKFAPLSKIYFADSLINGNLSELAKLCDLIIAAGLKIRWEASARFRPDMNPTLFRKMKKAGCYRLMWGLESGSQRVLDLMGKNVALDVARRNMIETWEAGIENYLPLIVGFPGETVSDFLDSLRFCHDLKQFGTFINFEPLAVLPHSPIYYRFRDFGLVDNHETDWVTQDGANTPEVRRFRQLLSVQTLTRVGFDLGGSTGIDQLAQLDYRQPALVNEALEVLLTLWAETDGLEALADQFGVTLLSGPLDSQSPRNQLKVRLSDAMISSDMHASFSRVKILGLLSDGLRRWLRPADVGQGNQANLIGIEKNRLSV